MRIAGLTRGDRGPAVDLFYKAHKNPAKYFDTFEDYKKFADKSLKPSSRNISTDQKAVNAWVLSRISGDQFDDADKKKSKDDKDGLDKFSYDDFFDSPGRGGKGGGQGGGSQKGKLTKGIEDKGLDFYDFGSMTPAEFDLFKEIRLRNVDGDNAQALQNIINSGKTEVAAIQRDASIYGSLVSGFW